MRASRGELLTARFWAKVNITDGCWEWTGGGHPYARLKAEGHTRQASHISWELAYGPIPSGVQICHHCDNPHCVRPDHLFLGTQRDNLADASAKGRLRTRDAGNRGNGLSGERHPNRIHPERMARGEHHGRAKMTEEGVIEARRLSAEGWTLARLSERYGVLITTLSMIIRRETWQHVP